jgi:hypothetical protein
MKFRGIEVLTSPDAFNRATKHRSAHPRADRIMIRPHSMLSIFLLLQSHIDFLCGHEAPHMRTAQSAATRYENGNPIFHGAALRVPFP